MSSILDYSFKCYTHFMIYAVGLGNKGDEYEGTRHNAGRSLLIALAKKNKFTDWKYDKVLDAQKAKGEIEGESFTFILPETYMNNSGRSVKALKLSNKQLEKCVVVYDDLDMPIGKLKLSFNRGSGGHNGIKSIINHLKTEAFPRLRIGVSPHTPGGKIKKPSGEKEVLNFLMKTFTPKEQEELKKVIKKVSESLVLISDRGQAIATNEINSW